MGTFTRKNMRNHPGKFRAYSIIPRCEIEETEVDALLGCESRQPNNFNLEIIRIRNKAIYMLISRHGFTLEQAMSLTLNDLDLIQKNIAVKNSEESNSYQLAMTEDTMNALVNYLRVRSPTKERRLFLVEHDSEKGNALGNTLMQQLNFREVLWTYDPKQSW